MSSTMKRRRFLKAVGAGVLSTAGVQLVSHPLARAEESKSDLPAGKIPRLFSGCCAYTFRHEFASGALTLETFIEHAVSLGLDGVDMTVYYMKSTDPAYLANLRHLGYKNGVPLSGAACNTSMVQADPAARADVLNQIKKWVDVTDQLGAPHLRVFAGKLPSGVSLSEATTWVVETMKPACDYAGKKGITLGIEDHSGVSQSSDVCVEIMQRVNSPFAGINIDISHFAPTPTKDSYAQIAACMPYASHTHIRNTFDDGSKIDMDRVWKMFADAGFKGYMSYEGEEFSTSGVPEQIAEIQRLCKKYSSV